LHNSAAPLFEKIGATGQKVLKVMSFGFLKYILREREKKTMAPVCSFRDH